MVSDVYQTTYDLLREELRGVLWAVVESGPGAEGGMGSVPWRVCTALYSLVEGHPVDRWGRCRSCRRPGAVLGWVRRRCQGRVWACYRLQRPDETLLLNLLVRELNQGDLCTSAPHSPAVPRPPLPGGDSPRAGRPDPDYRGSVAQQQDEAEGGWLRRDGDPAVDDAGSVVLAWRTAAGQTQTEVAGVLGTTQQHLSQIETGQRPVSLELRRKMVAELGIAAEDLGLSSGCARELVSRDDASPEIAASRLRWRDERRWLNQHRSELAKLAVQLYPAEYRIPRTALLAPAEWLVAEPMELGALALRLDEGPQTMEVNGTEPESELTRPLRTAGLRFERYTSAVKCLSPPRLFTGGPSYRLLDFSLPSRQLEFGLATYFDKIDVCEALGHELAAVCLAEELPRSVERLRGRLPFRELVGDPFDLRRRAAIPGIATLTIRLRRYPAEPSFLLHWRDPAKVAGGGGTYGVIPQGEFEASSMALWDRRNDFDLWRNIVREYSEELLGEPEHDGTRSQSIDYEQWPLFQRLQQARADGSVGVFFLGLGQSALTLTAAVLTVMVIDDDVFSDVFGSTVRFNEEGEIVAIAGGAPAEGVPFTEAVVRRMLETEPMTASGAACLALAWKHRDALGL